MSEKDRQRYQTSNLPIPPSRMRSGFINNLFCIDEFKSTYLSYVRNKQFQLDFKNYNKFAIKEFFKNADSIIQKTNKI